MGLIELFILAVGLSMDAFAVSICKGLSVKKVGVKECCIVGAWFGGFQALMPLIGYLLGSQFKDYITSIDHWIAFILLLIIGVNMIRESGEKEEDEEVWNRLNAFEERKGKYYIIPDYVEDFDAERIVELFGNLKLLTGGSGIIEELAKKSAADENTVDEYEGTQGQALIIAGSCSKATLGQIEKFINDGGKTFKINPIRMLYEKQRLSDVWNYVIGNAESPVLVYSSENPEDVKYNQRHGADKISACLEQSMADLANLAVRNGYTRIIVAGGETSGAVTQKLGFNAYLIGESVAPGVPVMTPVERRDIRIVLKSGNFGDEDFFAKALKITKR